MVEVGGLYSLQPGPNDFAPTPSSASPAVAGNSFGLFGGVAVALSASADVGVEFSVPSRYEVLQTARYGDLRIDNDHRDAILSELVRLHSDRRQAHRVRLEAVAGVSQVWESTLQRSATSVGPPGGTGPFGPFSAQTELTRITFGLTGGMNLVWTVGKHFDFGPLLRVHWISRAAVGEENGSLGLGAVIVRPAVAAGIRF